jgi:hypothetical protein
MKKLVLLSLSTLIIAASSCKKNDDISPTDGTPTPVNTKAKYKSSFDVAGAQYGSLSYSFVKDGSQLERYDGVFEADKGVNYTHIWLVDMPASAKTVEDYVALTLYFEKQQTGTFDIDYYGKGLGYTAITLRLGKTENDVWVCYKGKVTVTEVNKLGEPIAGTYDGEFFQANTTKTITVKNGIFSVERKADF